MEALCHRIDHKRKAEGSDLHDARRVCKAAKLEAQRAASYTYFSLLWHEWLSRDLNKHDASNFQHSGAPLAFVYSERGQWKDYTKEVTKALITGFAAGQSSARFSVSGKVYLVDFLHMLQLNTQTGSVRSVAWTDQTGKCFAPSKCLEGHIQDFFCVRPYAQDDAFTCHAHPSVGHSHGFAQLGDDKLAKVPEHDQEFTFVKETFLGGFSSFSKHAIVMGVYKISYTGSLGQVKLQTFTGLEQATGEARGDANVQYAWHGTSKNGVSGIIQHGFGQPGVPKHGVVYGAGVYLAPVGHSHISAMYSDMDENGEQHMLLCKVIMGKTEQVYPASEQFHPSNEEYDTGVDDADDPKRYIVWSTRMNTHILPQFVVSFKLEPSLRAVMLGRHRQNQMLRIPLSSQPSWNAVRGSKGMELPTEAKATRVLPPNKPLAGTCTDRDASKACSCPSAQRGPILSTVVDPHRSPRSPWVSIPDLLSMVEPKLNCTALSTLQKLYCEFQIGRLPRMSLVKMIRCIVGDGILQECLNSNAVNPARSCSTQALCMDKDCQSSVPSPKC